MNSGQKQLKIVDNIFELFNSNGYHPLEKNIKAHIIYDTYCCIWDGSELIQCLICNIKEDTATIIFYAVREGCRGKHSINDMYERFMSKFGYVNKLCWSRPSKNRGSKIAPIEAFHRRTVNGKC